LSLIYEIVFWRTWQERFTLTTNLLSYSWQHSFWRKYKKKIIEILIEKINFCSDSDSCQLNSLYFWHPLMLFFLVGMFSKFKQLIHFSRPFRLRNYFKPCSFLKIYNHNQIYIFVYPVYIFNYKLMLIAY
jgi:hypothetical protein